MRASYLERQILHYLDSGIIQSGQEVGVLTGCEIGVNGMSLQIRRHKLSRRASSFGDGRHFRGALGSNPDRFQKASKTSRFIWRLVVMYRLIVATDA